MIGVYNSKLVVTVTNEIFCDLWGEWYLLSHNATGLVAEKENGSAFPLRYISFKEGYSEAIKLSHGGQNRI